MLIFLPDCLLSCALSDWLIVVCFFSVSLLPGLVCVLISSLGYCSRMCVLMLCNYPHLCYLSVSCSYLSFLTPRGPFFCALLVLFIFPNKFLRCLGAAKWMVACSLPAPSPAATTDENLNGLETQV